MIETILVFGLILIGFSTLHYISDRIKFPYTILLLIFGFFAKSFFASLHIELDLHMDSEFIYSVILPLLLFGAALHLNFHQFRIHIKTISFFATFGLFVSITIIGGLLALLLNWRLIDGLLFGAIISATDPIAVLALFKSIGGPKRLALIADGESMLNDATAVVVFRILLAVAIGQQQLSHLTFLSSGTTFLYVFFGSILLGAILGYLTALLLNKIENSLIIETTLTLGASLIVFTAAEHYFHLSGVITAVVAGLFVGNFSGLRRPTVVSHFVQEFWDYVGYIAVSFVFFFATVGLDLNFLAKYYPTNFIVIISVLLARAVSVYFSSYITNTSTFFDDEPNIPLSWQHILNWGGLRGVIPLVLVFTLPDSYSPKQTVFDLTFTVLLFTLFVNGSTIAILLKKLKLHIPSFSEKVRRIHNSLFNYDEGVEKLEKAEILGISPETINERIAVWREKEKQIAVELNSLDTTHYKNALAMQCLTIERDVFEELLMHDEMSEASFFEMDAQLDLQADAIDYPTLYTRGVGEKGMIPSALRFRQQVLRVRRNIVRFTWIAQIFGLSKEKLVHDRYMLVRGRLIASRRVLLFLKEVKKNCLHEKFIQCLDAVSKKYELFVQNAENELTLLRKDKSIKSCEVEILNYYLARKHSEWIM